MAKAAIGFNRSKREGDDEEAINRLFSPEFRNRLDAIIAFGALPPTVIAQVVEKFVFQLEAQLSDRNITIELTPEANAWLAERGYDDKFGARPLARVIQEYIKKPLAEEILFGRLKDGGTVRVLVEAKDGEKALGFEYIKADAPIKPRDPEDDEGEGDAAPKSRAKRPRKPRGGSKAGPSIVPKVPLGEG
jgi:ATP-dependent Clp protease ATP-binding subunit ClpA